MKCDSQKEEKGGISGGTLGFKAELSLQERGDSDLKTKMEEGIREGDGTCKKDD